MINDYGPALRRSRRRAWRRNPRVVLAGVVVSMAGSVLLGGNVYGALSAVQPAQVQVHAGDTLWSIAAAHYPSADPRERVDQIITLNHIEGSAITPGEILLLPPA
jgi:hypothetical protein